MMRATRATRQQVKSPEAEESNPYLEQVRLKRKKNEEKIQEMGLDKYKPQKKKLTLVKKRPLQYVEPRRSNRVSKKPVEFKPGDLDNEKEISEQIKSPEAEEPNPYLEQVRLKRKKNKEKIQEMGLDKYKPQKKKRIVVKKRPLQSAEPRRSNRVSKKPVEFNPGDLDTYERELFGKMIARRKKQSKNAKQKRRQYNLGHQIGAEERKKLVDVPSEEWVKDMEEYFRSVEGNSDSNVQRVMTVVNKLVNGMGVRHPQTAEFFLKNDKIDLGRDFRAMLDDASEWVYDNGGDKGNGWLIEHPVKKLWVYQQARAEKGGVFFPQHMNM